jgi:hypothetical protein
VQSEPVLRRQADRRQALPQTSRSHSVESRRNSNHAFVVSAFGTKRTSVFALRMSAFGGKADITVAYPQQMQPLA